MRSGRASAARPGSWGDAEVLVMDRLRLTGSGRIGEGMGSRRNRRLLASWRSTRRLAMSPDRAPKTRRSPAWPMRPTWRSLRRAAGSWPGRWRATIASRGRGALAARAQAGPDTRPAEGEAGQDQPGAAQPGPATSEATTPGTDTGSTLSAASPSPVRASAPPPAQPRPTPVRASAPPSARPPPPTPRRVPLRPSRRRSDPMAPWPVRLGPADGRTIPSRIAGRIGMATSVRATSGRPSPRGIPLITAGPASRSRMAPTRSERTAPSPTCCRP